MKKGQRQCLTSPDRQLRKHEKTMQKPCSGWSCGWSCNGSFGGSSGLRPARSRNSQTPAGFKPNLSKNLTCSTVARKGLEEHRSASVRNSETPQQDKPCQNSPPYRTGMEWRRRWPHGLGPKHPKHGFFGALPLGQRGRRIYAYLTYLCKRLVFICT